MLARYRKEANWRKEIYPDRSTDKKIIATYSAYLGDKGERIAQMSISGDKQTGVKHITFYNSPETLKLAFYFVSALEPIRPKSKYDNTEIEASAENKQHIKTFFNCVEAYLPGFKNAIFNNFTLQQLAENAGFYHDLKELVNGDSLDFEYDTCYAQAKSAYIENNFLLKIHSVLTHEIQKNCDYLTQRKAYVKAEDFIWLSSIDEIKINLSNGYDINCVDIRGDTILHAAAARGDLNLVQFLLKQGAQVDIVNRDGETPLLNAARYNRVECAKLLIQHGAKVVGDSESSTPSYGARKSGFELLATAIETNSDSAWLAAIEDKMKRQVAAEQQKNKLLTDNAMTAVLRERSTLNNQQSANVLSGNTNEVTDNTLDKVVSQKQSLY